MSPENLFVVPDDMLAKFRDLQRRRNEQAFIAGQALLEHEQRRKEILVRFHNVKERNERLGALHYEFRSITDNCLRLVEASGRDEAALGEQAICALGLDFNSGTFRIDIDNGAVLRLADSKWSPALRSPQ